MSTPDCVKKIRDARVERRGDFDVLLVPEEELRQNSVSLPEYEQSSDNVENKVLVFDGDNLIWR